MRDRPFKYEFIVCKNLGSPIILGLDFMREYSISTYWTKNKTFTLIHKDELFVESVDLYVSGPQLMSQDSVAIPSRSAAVFRVSIDIEDCHLDKTF